MPLLGATARRFVDQSTSAGLARLLELLDPTYEAWWRGELAQRNAEMTPELARLGNEVLDKQLALVARLHEAGVVLLPGSAAPQPWLFPGQALHQELDLWVRRRHPAGRGPSPGHARSGRDPGRRGSARLHPDRAPREPRGDLRGPDPGTGRTGHAGRDRVARPLPRRPRPRGPGPERAHPADAPARGAVPAALDRSAARSGRGPGARGAGRDRCPGPARQRRAVPRGPARGGRHRLPRPRPCTRGPRASRTARCSSPRCSARGASSGPRSRCGRATRSCASRDCGPRASGGCAGP